MLEPGARVVNSVLRGPLIIGAGREIIDSYIGPSTAIDPGCRIKGCRIEDSMVMEDSRIEEMHWPIVKSMIGRNVELQGRARRGRRLQPDAGRPQPDRDAGWVRKMEEKVTS